MAEITPLNLSEELTKSKDDKFLTDVTFDLGSKNIYAHKLVLATVSGFFKGVFYSGVGSPDAIPVRQTDPIVFEMYIDYVYGKHIQSQDWKLMMRLFKFIDFTQTVWHNKDQNVLELEIPSDDYVDYLHDLIELYREELPVEVIAKSAKYIKTYVDLSKFTPDVIKIITHSDKFDPICKYRKEIYQNLASKGFNLDTIMPIEDKLTENPILSISRKEPLLLKVTSGAPAWTWTDEQYGYAARGKAAVGYRQSCDFSPISANDAPIVRLVFESNAFLKAGDVVVVTKYSEGFEKIQHKKSVEYKPLKDSILVLDYKIYGY